LNPNMVEEDRWADLLEPDFGHFLPGPSLEL